MSDLLVAQRSSGSSTGSPAAAQHLVDRLAGHAVRPATVMSQAAVAPPRGRIDSRSSGAVAPLGVVGTDLRGRAGDGTSAAVGWQATPGRADRVSGGAALGGGAAGLTSPSAALFRSFLTATDGPGASSMSLELDHLDEADGSRQTLREFLQDSTLGGEGDGMDLSAPPPLATAAVDMDELTDRVVRRIERRVVDELERRGRSGTRRTF